MLRGSEVSKDSYHSPVKKLKQLNIYKVVSAKVAVLQTNYYV